MTEHAKRIASEMGSHGKGGALSVGSPASVSNVAQGRPAVQDQEGDVTQAVGMLIGIGGQYSGGNIKLTKDEPLTLGRDGNRVALAFTNPKVSGVHMTVTFAVSHYIIRDLSSYGVFAEYPNGKRQKLTKGADTSVPRGTVILFADTERFKLK